ncbi:MAG: hypothetical protein JSR33_06255 [Proteobacteria bacterium]|nr:hypothetical protein [Pseudomonadota bacterium]
MTNPEQEFFFAELAKKLKIIENRIKALNLQIAEQQAGIDDLFVCGKLMSQYIQGKQRSNKKICFYAQKWQELSNIDHCILASDR